MEIECLNSRCCRIEEGTVSNLQLVKPKTEKDFESQRLTETQFSDNSQIKVDGLNCLEPLDKMCQVNFQVRMQYCLIITNEQNISGVWIVLFLFQVSHTC